MNPLQKNSLDRFITNFIGLLVLILLWENAGYFSATSEKFERTTLDFRYRHVAPSMFPSDKIVFIDIDESSLNFLKPSVGQWPWKRDVWSKTLQLLSIARPKAILFDILLTDNDKQNPDTDNLLAQTVRDYPSVSFAMSFESTPFAQTPRFPASANNLELKFNSAHFGQSSHQTFSRPFSPLWENLSHVHFVNSSKDEDGLFRSSPIYLNYDYIPFSSLPLKALQIYFDDPKSVLSKNKLVLLTPEKMVSIPLTKDHRFNYHYYQSDFTTFSFGSLYTLVEKKNNSTVDSDRIASYLKKRFNDKILIVGSSAPNLRDLKQTPVNRQYPGALLHATAISNILEGNLLQKIFSGWEILITAVLMALIYVNSIFNTNTILRKLLPSILLASYGFLSLFLFHVEQIDLPLATPLMFGLFSYLDTIIYFFELRIISHSEK